jgi:hypothetical protein
MQLLLPDSAHTSSSSCDDRSASEDLTARVIRLETALEIALPGVQAATSVCPAMAETIESRINIC